MEEVTILALINDPHYDDNKLFFLESKKSILITTKDFLINVRGKNFRIRKENFGRIIVNNDFSMVVYCNYSRKLTHGFYPETMSHVMKGELSIKLEEYAKKISNKEIEKMGEY